MNVLYALACVFVPLAWGVAVALISIRLGAKAAGETPEIAQDDRA